MNKDYEPEDIGRGNFTVRLRTGESTETLIKRFLKKQKKEGLMDEIYERQYYKKPSVVRREKAVKRELLLNKQKEKEKIFNDK